ncbi:hypothetical protein V5F59_11475 [Xanthobacter autotrophicus DSM 431]|uniref:DUF6895 family protein n=1 Tax=Xanthobacter nonsaccharivorans TaxID=3119912 RepID=UPI0037294246
MRWLSSNAEHLLDIALRADERQQDTKRVSSYKLLAEIGLMLMLCGRSGQFARSEDYQEILSAFDAAVGKIRLPTEDLPSCLRFLSGVTPALEVNGLNSDRFRDDLMRVLRQDMLHVRDQTPWSILSLTYFLDLCGIQHSLPSSEDLYLRSILGSRPPIHCLSNHELYALSHLIFFFGDFGDNRGFFTRLPDHRPLSIYLDHVTAACLIDGDWDLTGEFLIGYECIGADHSLMRDFAWRQILQHQRPSGEIDVPRRIQMKSDQSDASPLGMFERHYHQTLVSIIASNLYAQHHV